MPSQSAKHLLTINKRFDVSLALYTRLALFIRNESVETAKENSIQV